MQPRVSEYVLDCAERTSAWSHDNPECSRQEAEETFNRFNGSASVQLATRDWHHTVILVGDRQRLVWNIAWVTTREFVRIMSKATKQRASVLVESSSPFCFWRTAFLQRWKRFSTSCTVIPESERSRLIVPIHDIVTPREQGEKEVARWNFTTYNRVKNFKHVVNTFFCGRILSFSCN